MTVKTRKYRLWSRGEGDDDGDGDDDDDKEDDIGGVRKNDREDGIPVQNSETDRSGKHQR